MNIQASDTSIRKMDISGILNYAIYMICIAFIIMVAIRNKNFFTVSNFLLILQQSSPFLIASTGMAFVLMSGGIDISVGQNMLLSAAVGAKMAQFLMSSGLAKPDTVLLLIITIITSALVGSVIGCINGITIAKFKIIPFIATFAMTNIVRGIALVIMGGQSQTLDGVTRTINTNIGGVFPLVLILAIVMLLTFNFVSRSLPFGRKVKAIGRSADNAHKVGIKVVQTKIIVHTLCGAAVGVCGIIGASQMQYVQSSFGTGNEFIIISGCILGGVSLKGGKGSIIPGAVIGVITVQMIVNGLIMINASPYIYTIARGVIIFMAIMIESIKYKGILK